MKCVGAKDGDYSFLISDKEKELLAEVVSLYPITPATHHRLTRSEDRPEDQKLLETAMAAHKREGKRQLTRMLKTAFEPADAAKNHRLHLKEAQVEWLLQALNDVRVGSWARMGSPDGPAETLAALNESTAPYLWAMEAAGHFQSVLLQALNRGGEEG